MTLIPDLLDKRHAVRERPLSSLSGGVLTWRESGRPDRPALVLLHGIGSGALGFTSQLEAFADTHRVLAWDAPGYAHSACLIQRQPLAIDYATVLADWLRAEGVSCCDVLGHSLGAIVAAAFAADAAPAAGIQVRRLVLASPALGYGDQPEPVRVAKRRERTDLIQRLGPQGLAAERAARLCTPQADAAAKEIVRWNMARSTPEGYAQAAHLLAEDRLQSYAARVRVPVHVLCGERDMITPLAASAAFAESIGAAFTVLPGAAHACYVEHAADFNAALRCALEPQLPATTP